MPQVRKFSRKSDSRNHLLRNLSTSFILYERLEATEAKCAELKAIIDSLIVTAKKNDLSARRAIKSYLFDNNAVDKMFAVLVPRFNNLNCGFTKITKISYRKGDGALKCAIELINPANEKVLPIKELNEESK